MILAILLDLVALYFGWWPVGFLAKSAYIVLFFSQIIRGNYYLAMGLRSAMRAEMLEKDLENANATIAVSQIRSHFIFNILNAISGMCKYDPAKADETIVLFARYLRANVNILNNDAPVPFADALEYLEGYIALEQVRFGEKIHFVKEIEADDFMIPSLLMQPVAENAIKHGLLPKPKGGTITLRTERIGKNYRITIKDDGIGFDLHAPDDPLSVGLENVRVRLHHAGGKMKIESAPGKGTTVTFTIPCKEANG
jgi:sensor histidine kinase YesM